MRLDRSVYSFQGAVCSLALGLAVLCADSPAVAASRALTLSVERAPGAEQCPDAPALVEEVQRLGTRRELVPGARGQGPVHFDVRLERTGRGWTAVLAASGERRGQRRLTDQGRSCDGLAAAVALTLAMLVDSEQNDIAQAHLESAPPAASAAPAAPPPARSAPPRRRSTRWPAAWSPLPSRAERAVGHEASTLGASVAVSAVAALGILAHPGPGATVEGDFDFNQRWHFGFGGLWLASQSVQHGPGHIDLSFFAAEVDACRGLFGEQKFAEFGVCLRGAAGLLSGSGHDYDVYTASKHRPWIAAAAGARLDGLLGGPVEWTAGLDLWFPLSDQRFAVQGVPGLAFETPRVGACARLGLRVSIW